MVKFTGTADYVQPLEPIRAASGSSSWATHHWVSRRRHMKALVSITNYPPRPRIKKRLSLSNLNVDQCGMFAN